MRKYIKFVLVGCVVCMTLLFFHIFKREQSQSTPNVHDTDLSVLKGENRHKDFVLDNVLHSRNHGDIHYHVYIPDSYDGKEAYALYITLPGYQGLYFQGVGKNLQTEEFGFVTQEKNQKMIIGTLQLEDWGETLANQTIDLIEYFLSHYNIDKNQVYANGYSGGGETMSLVMGKKPYLLKKYLHASSKWDGNLNVLVENEIPVYIVIGENDEYYGS